MNYSEIVDQQIALLTKVNEQLAGQGAAGASMEIRKNIRLIINLAEMGSFQSLEFRVRDIESFILGDSKNKGLGKYIDGINEVVDDHEERILILENRIGEEETWEIMEEEETPEYGWEETLIGLLERVKVLEAKTVGK